MADETKTERALLAFHVSDGDGRYDGDCSHHVIFATSEEAAWKLPVRGFFDSVAGVWRAPEYDHHAPGPITPLQLIEHGWWFECRHCGQHVSQDGDRVDEETGDFEGFDPVESGDDVFCDERCRGRYFAEVRVRRARRAAVVELVHLRYPEAVKVARAENEGRGPGLDEAWCDVVLRGFERPVHFKWEGNVCWASGMLAADMQRFKALYGTKGGDDAS